MPAEQSPALAQFFASIVTSGTRLCPILDTMDAKPKKRIRSSAALTLTELLCVIAILAILAALYLPALLRAYKRVRAFLSATF
jgi:prepilin-type N-terminal cleavage/methylation domain-containing protein